MVGQGMVSDHLFGAGTLQWSEGAVVVIFTLLKSSVLQEKNPHSELAQLFNTGFQTILPLQIFTKGDPRIAGRRPRFQSPTII
jgi:hypothetical protein